MGWASGSGLAERVFKSGRDHIPDLDARRRFYDEVIAAFEDFDCDTLNEVIEFDPDPDPVLVAALQASWDE